LPAAAPPQIAEAFREAHPARRVPKKWVQDSVKENFEWRGTKLGWALKPAAARLPDPAAGAAAAAAALAAAAPAAPALGGAAAAAATAGDAMLVDGGAAEGLAGQSGAAAAPHTAGIERFFTAKASLPGKRLCLHAKGIRAGRRLGQPTLYSWVEWGLLLLPRGCCRNLPPLRLFPPRCARPPRLLSCGPPAGS
jgi:hypothetical protein